MWVSMGDRGGNWTALKSNFPTVPVDDIEIQARENDLVAGDARAIDLDIR